MTVSELPHADQLRPEPGFWAAWLQRLNTQPYVLLSLTSLFWAGNAVVGRYAAGHIPPVALAFLRWSLAFLILVPFVWRHLRRDWPAIRQRLGVMMLLSLTGVTLLNILQYTALQYTQALNGLLLQSVGPFFVAVWSLVLLGMRLTWPQAGGLMLSLIGVCVIILQGNVLALSALSFNKGDLIFLASSAIFGLYSVLLRRRPAIHPLSFLGFTFGCGSLFMVPMVGWELSVQPLPAFNLPNVLMVAYIAIFPSILAYLCFNRGVALVGPNRAAPFFHLMPVFGAAMAIVFLGEELRWFHVFGFVLVLGGISIAARPTPLPGKA
jgi:drug/metabolite transporter (DMT)-like permease